jgi:gluconolactonase
MMTDEFKVLDERFERLFNPTAHLHRLYTGCRWAEGPAYFPAGRYLIWSDIPNNRLLRYDECNGEVSIFRSPSNNANGNTVDRQGRLVTCEHSGRRVSRTEHDGRISCIADRYDGKRLNSPNDVVVKSDGSIWFTDPTYGIDSDYEGDRAESEIGASYVYRVDAQNGAIHVVADDFAKPNGLAFSPDEKKLYIADTGRTHGRDLPAHIRVCDVREDGRLGANKVFADSTAGLFDGFRIDEAGRLWSSSAEGIHCLHPDGTLIGKIPVPEIVSNLCFGGLKRNQLYICGTTSLYTVHLHTNGARTF